MKLSYKAVNKEGKKILGVIEAGSVEEAAAYLRSKDFVPVDISKKEKGKLGEIFPFFTKKVKASDVVLFTRQLSSMLSAGLTILKALEILKNQTENPVMIEVLDSIIRDIQEGSSFSLAISKYPDVFPTVYISIVKASESSGLLDKALIRLSENLEKQEKLKGTVKSALMYPAIVVIMMVAVVFIMMIFVIPQLSVLYASLNIPLPLPTRLVMGFSRFIVVFWPVIVGLIFLLAFFYKRWHKTETGELVVDNILLKLPVFGTLLKKSILTEFSRTLGLLVGSGTLVVDSLIQTSGVTGNIYFKNAILDISKRVEKGVTIGDGLSLYSLFPPVLVQLVKIGEQTGKLDETLLKASEYFEQEVNQSVKNLTTLLEPAIMVVLGIGVAFLIISVITPIYRLTSAIQ